MREIEGHPVMRAVDWTIWVGWAGSIFVAAMAVVVWVFLNFQTKSEAAYMREAGKDRQTEIIKRIDQRMDAMDHKLDLILQDQ